MNFLSPLNYEIEFLQVKEKDKTFFQEEAGNTSKAPIKTKWVLFKFKHYTKVKQEPSNELVQPQWLCNAFL